MVHKKQGEQLRSYDRRCDGVYIWFHPTCASSEGDPACSAIEHYCVRICVFSIRGIGKETKRKRVTAGSTQVATDDMACKSGSGCLPTKTAIARCYVHGR